MSQTEAEAAIDIERQFGEATDGRAIYQTLVGLGFYVRPRMPSLYNIFDRRPAWHLAAKFCEYEISAGVYGGGDVGGGGRKIVELLCPHVRDRALCLSAGDVLAALLNLGRAIGKREKSQEVRKALESVR